MNLFEEIKKSGMTDEQYESCIADIAAKKDGENDYDWQEIIDMYHLPLTPDALRKSQATIFGGASR